MTTMIRNWTKEPVDPAALAPDAYGIEGGDATIWSYVGDGKFREFCASVPYQKGAVVWMERHGKPVLARVMGVFSEEDRYGDRRAKFKVQLATKAGYWSQRFLYTWPGYIARGYKRAAMIDEVPAEA